jgi:hypothetical protein
MDLHPWPLELFDDICAYLFSGSGGKSTYLLYAAFANNFAEP